MMQNACTDLSWVWHGHVVPDTLARSSLLHQVTCTAGLYYQRAYRLVGAPVLHLPPWLLHPACRLLDPRCYWEGGARTALLQCQCGSRCLGTPARTVSTLHNLDSSAIRVLTATYTAVLRVACGATVQATAHAALLSHRHVQTVLRQQPLAVLGCFQRPPHLPLRPLAYEFVQRQLRQRHHQAVGDLAEGGRVRCQQLHRTQGGAVPVRAGCGGETHTQCEE